MNRRVVGAGVLGAVGLLIAVWSLWPANLSTQASDGRRQNLKGINQHADEKQVSQFVETGQSDVLAGVVDRALDALREALAKLPPDQQITHDQQTKFVKDVGQLWSMYVGADYERYVEYVTSHDGRLTALSDDQSPDAEREFWLSTDSGIAGNGVDPTSVRILARWIAGQEVKQERIAVGTAKIRSKDRYDIPTDPATGRLTIFEALLPVQFKWGNAAGGDVVFGISLAWDDKTQQWVVWQTAIYNTGGAKSIVCPTY